MNVNEGAKVQYNSGIYYDFHGLPVMSDQSVEGATPLPACDEGTTPFTILRSKSLLIEIPKGVATADDYIFLNDSVSLFLPGLGRVAIHPDEGISVDFLPGVPPKEVLRWIERACIVNVYQNRLIPLFGILIDIEGAWVMLTGLPDLQITTLLQSSLFAHLRFKRGGVHVFNSKAELISANHNGSPQKLKRLVFFSPVLPATTAPSLNHLTMFDYIARLRTCLCLPLLVRPLEMEPSFLTFAASVGRASAPVEVLTGSSQQSLVAAAQMICSLACSKEQAE